MSALPPPGLLPALAIVTAAILAGPAGAQAPQPRTNLSDVEDEVMCLVCGTTLELSESQQADQERDLIRSLVAQGLTKEEIKDRLVLEYGEEVLAVPDDEGFGLAAWVVPPLALLLAAGGIAFFLVRNRRRSGSDPEAPEPDAAASARIDREIAESD